MSCHCVLCVLCACHGHNAQAYLSLLLDMMKPGARSSRAALPASKKRALDTDSLGGASGSAARPATLSVKVEQKVEQFGHLAQPALAARSNRAAQPASKKRTFDTDTASGSAARPATLSEQVEQKVEQLGHYPKRFKTPTTDKERAENSLADKICKQWSKLSDVTKAKLTKLQQKTQNKDAALEQQVEQLGRYPKRIKTPTTDKERAENSLAERICKHWSKLSDATKAKLTRLQQEAQSKDGEAQAERRTADILERLRAFGKMPQEHDYSQASNKAIIAEAKLAHDLRKCRSSGILNQAAVAEIDELHWIWLREREAEAMERNAAAKTRRRNAVSARKTRLRTLLGKLRSSKSRCDCNDFAHWYALWRCNPELAMRLRFAGHHFKHCRLASSAVQPVHSIARERRTACNAGTCLDPDTGAEVDSDMSRASVFESAGLLASCSKCEHAIVCGVLHSGSCNREPTNGELDEDIDPRAERPLRFECHELVSGTPIAADHAMVSFLHYCHTGGGATPLISRDWEKNMLPYIMSPGMDVGMTGDDYAWLLRQCKVKADWQLNFRISFAGRLSKYPRPSFDYRGKPAYSYALGRMPCMGDGRSPGGQTTAGDYIYTRTHPFCCLTADSAAPPVEACGPPFGHFRARARPLRQEPEWQLGDVEVQEAWRQIDEEALDKCSPYEMLALAQDVVGTLGRWPVVLGSCNCPQERRLEVRLALLFNAYVSKPFSTHPRREFFEAIACKTKLKALRERSLSATSAAQPGLIDIVSSAARPALSATSASQPCVSATSAAQPAARWLCRLRGLGLHMRPMDGRDVFSHTPAKSILQERAQEAVLRKVGAYEPLELCYQATKPWGRFFIFDKDFVAYNRAGMRAEDPSAHKWSASKLWIDYTPFVKALDWTQALKERIMQDNANLQHLLRARKKEQSTSTRRCACGRRGGACSCQSDDIEEKRCHDDPIDPNNGIWDWYVKEHCPDVDPGVLIDVRAALTGTWLNRKFQFYRTALSWMPRSDRLNSPSIYSNYLLWESSSCFYHSDLPGWTMPFLFWAGGTYARRPEDFLPEQSSAAWLERFLLPLELKAPRFKWHESLRDLAKTWSSATWHGKAPHPYAINAPFPYASASMRKYFRDYYPDAKDVPRDSPWCNVQR